MVVRLAPSERPEGQASLHARQLTKEAILSSNEENSTPTKQPLPGWHLAMAAPCQLGTDRAPWGSEVDQIQRGSITIYSTYIYIEMIIANYYSQQGCPRSQVVLVIEK